MYRSPCGDPFSTPKDLNLKAVFVIAHVALLLVCIIWIATNRHLTHVSIPWTILVLRWPLNFENETHRCGLSVWIPYSIARYSYGGPQNPQIPWSWCRFIISSHQMVSSLFLVALCDESHLALLKKMCKHSLIRGKLTQDDDDDVSLIPMTYGNHID